VDLAAGIQVTELTSGQYDTVYNLLSLAIASLGFTGLYLVLSQRRVLPRYRNAIIVSAIVCFIATYHYIRIFDNFKDSYETTPRAATGSTRSRTSRSTRATGTSTGCSRAAAHGRDHRRPGAGRVVARQLLTKLVIAASDDRARLPG
jgi:hypothetical protein